MLRTFRTADIPQLPALLERNFPEEQALLGVDPNGMMRVVRRIYRWDARFVLALMSAFGRPVFRFLVIEADGKIVATTLLTYATDRSTYVSAVTVDVPYRRKGFARQLMRESARVTAESRRRYVVLDVLERNTPARELYVAEGFRLLREQSYMQRSLGGEPPLPTEAAPAGGRALLKHDEASLAELANGRLNPGVREVLPYSPRDFGVAPRVVGALESKTSAWVIDDGRGPIAFLRASCNEAMEAGHLTAPIVAAELDDRRIGELISTGLHYLKREGAQRALVEVPIESDRARRALTEAGFEEAFRLLTLYQPVAR